MERSVDIPGSLQKVLKAHGIDVDCADIFNYIKGVAQVTTAPPMMGPAGPMGQTGAPGRDGKDAYDKYRWNPGEEVMVEFSWKGIAFRAPIPRQWAFEIPQGELNFGDVAMIQMLYGSGLVERIATFWRREYDSREDMSLFITEEDLCRLKDIHQSSSFPDHFPDSWAKRYRQLGMESPPGT
ncbi:hypothetical protein POP15_209 [Pectobacterium phage POP15]|nr:hypothetical protein POP15_209 [Pectobacterium phage POP15]